MSLRRGAGLALWVSVAVPIGLALAQDEEESGAREVPCVSDTECAAPMVCERSESGGRGVCRRPASAGTTARARAALSPAEQLEEAQRIHERGQALSRRVAGMLDEARRENDVIRVTCLDDKLTQINAHLRNLGGRLDALREAAQLGDTGRRNHEFTVITVLGQNLTELDRAANECIGQDLFETGTTRVTTTIDPSVPDDDPGVIPTAPAPTVPFIPPPPSA